MRCVMCYMLGHHNLWLMKQGITRDPYSKKVYVTSTILQLSWHARANSKKFETHRCTMYFDHSVIRFLKNVEIFLFDAWPIIIRVSLENN
jgi:hypothetical protein